MPAIHPGRIALFAGLMGNAAGHGLLFATLPALGRRLGLDDLQTGGLLSLGALALILTGPLWGGIADRRGRRPVLLVGLTGATLAPAAFGLILALALTGQITGDALFTALLAVRLLQACCSGGLLPAAQAHIADITTPGRRAGGMGLLGAAFGLGSVIGAALAWLGAGNGLPYMFLAVAGLTALAGIAVWLLLPDQRLPHQPALSAQPMAGIAALVRRSWRFLIVTLVAITLYALLQQLTGVRLRDQFALAPDQAVGMAGATLMVASLTMVAAQGMLIGWLGWSPIRLLRIGAGVTLAAMIGVSIIQSPAQHMLVLAAFGLGIGLMLPGNLAALSMMAGSQAQARAAGLNAIGQGLGMVIGPMLGALLYRFHPLLPLGVGIGAMLLVVALVLTLRPTKSGDHSHG